MNYEKLLNVDNISTRKINLVKSEYEMKTVSKKDIVDFVKTNFEDN